MHKKALELCLYVAGGGAFGVFLRWLEDQLAFNELGLADPSAFHFLVAAFILACAIVFWRFLTQLERRGYSLPPEIGPALGDQMVLHAILRWAFGGIMVLGGLLLFAKSETDKFVGMLRVLSALAVLSGVAYPLVLAESEREEPRKSLLMPLMLLPMLLYATWLLLSYRSNSINSVPLSYWVEMLTVIVAMVAYFRMAGFAFGVARTKRCMHAVMLSGTLCLMSLADERYMGMQLILLATAGQMLLYTWLMVQDLQKGEVKVEPKVDDGFEHL